MEDISTIFNGFNTAAILSGASTQEQGWSNASVNSSLGFWVF